MAGMTDEKPKSLTVFGRFLEQLKSSHLLMLLTGLFVLDVFIPDMLPFVDEIALGILTLLVARWKMRGAEPEPPPVKPPPKNVTPASER
jgi:hypothetical protein